MRPNLKQINFNVFVVGLIALAALPACTQAPGIVGDSDYQSGLSSSSLSSNYTGTLQLNSAGTTLAYGASMQFSASGGVPPYVYTASGPGTINPDTGVFVASALDGIATIQAFDLQGRSALAYVSVSASGAGPTMSGTSTTYRAGITQLTVSLYNNIGGCSAGTFNAGGVADMYGAPPVSYGDRQICVAKTSVISGSSVYADITVTPPGYHGQGISCPSGYAQVGSVPDCAGGICGGAQLICAQVAQVNSSSNYVTNFYVSNEGVHYQSGLGCPSGYTAAGSTVDCGGGYCSGYQTFCKAY